MHATGELFSLNFGICNVTKSYLAKPGELTPAWVVVDAEGQIVGRLAVKIATILMGKHKPTYTPHVDTGDYVVVVNADKIRFGGRPVAHRDHPYFDTKMLKKEYGHYTGYPGGRKVLTGEQLLDKHPEKILQLAVRRMLPKTKLGRAMLKKLKLYKGPSHPHQAQEPQPLSV